jgi:hypothetical protein
MKINLQNEIRQAVELSAECPAEHIETVAVVEMFGHQTVWEGAVEVFKLIGHPKAKRAYGWAYLDGKENRYVVVLEIPPVDSANTAVRLAIAQGAQK